MKKHFCKCILIWIMVTIRFHSRWPDGAVITCITMNNEPVPDLNHMSTCSLDLCRIRNKIIYRIWLYPGAGTDLAQSYGMWFGSGTWSYTGPDLCRYWAVVNKDTDTFICTKSCRRSGSDPALLHFAVWEANLATCGRTVWTALCSYKRLNHSERNRLVCWECALGATWEYVLN